MAAIHQMEGLKEVLINLHRHQVQFGIRVGVGLKLAGLALQRASQKLVPVDLGVLKASAYTRAEGVGLATKVYVGYTAAYALYVHELVAMKLKGQLRGHGHKGRYWDPQGKGQAKFLEQPFRTMTPELRKIIRDTARL